MPVQSDISSPGPEVTAITSMGGLSILPFLKPLSFTRRGAGVKLACFKQVSRIIGKFLICSRLASAGKTPPYGIWIFICEFELFANTLKLALCMPPLTSNMLIAVSSQLVSMLKILMCAVQGSNLCPCLRQRHALPTELTAHCTTNVTYQNS